MLADLAQPIGDVFAPVGAGVALDERAQGIIEHDGAAGSAALDEAQDAGDDGFLEVVGDAFPQEQRAAGA